MTIKGDLQGMAVSITGCNWTQAREVEVHVLNWLVSPDVIARIERECDSEVIHDYVRALSALHRVCGVGDGS